MTAEMNNLIRRYLNSNYFKLNLEKFNKAILLNHNF